jgi:serine/threonine protein kinase
MQNANPDSTEKKCAPNQDMGLEESDIRYERLDKLGEGTYGIVYKSRDRETNEVS